MEKDFFHRLEMSFNIYKCRLKSIKNKNLILLIFMGSEIFLKELINSCIVTIFQLYRHKEWVSGKKTQTYLLTQRFMGNMPVIIYHFIENLLLLSMLTSHPGMITFRIHTIRNMALIKIYTNISFEFNNFVLMKGIIKNMSRGGRFLQTVQI